MFLLVALAVMAGVLGVAWYLLDRSAGRTPSSDFVRDVYGAAVSFDRTYDSEGSSEDKSRVLLIEGEADPTRVLGTLSARGTWRRVGEGISRESDGLCAVAYAVEEYVGPTQEGANEVQAAATGKNAVVVSLLYC